MAIFNPENSIWRVTGKLVDLMLLSVFWLACSLPVVTLGPASAALYHTVVQCIRGNRRDSWTLFFRTFRDNLKVGVLTTLVVLAVAAALLFLHGLAYQMASAGQAEYVFYLCYTFLLLLPLGVACYLFPVLSRFTFGVGGLLSNCARLAIVHLPSTLAMALELYLALELLLRIPSPFSWSASSPPTSAPSLGRRRKRISRTADRQLSGISPPSRLTNRSAFTPAQNTHRPLEFRHEFQGSAACLGSCAGSLPKPPLFLHILNCFL